MFLIRIMMGMMRFIICSIAPYSFDQSYYEKFEKLLTPKK